MLLSFGRSVKPADTGVEGRVVGCGDGRGSEAELRRASTDFISRAEGLLVPLGILVLLDGGDVGR